MRRFTTVDGVTLTALPGPLHGLPEIVVPTLRRVYDLNASRHDELAGDDASTFAFNVYRNSWFWLEQEFAGQDGWKTARPYGSLVISKEGYRVHSYRWGQNEQVDLEAFRLDEADASSTKRQIAETNGQLRLAFEIAESTAKARPDLHDLVIVHAGNPEDGCCGVWIGAPIPANELTVSPWAWRESLWIIERSAQPTDSERETEPVVRHDELAEPDVEVVPVEDDESSTGKA